MFFLIGCSSNKLVSFDGYYAVTGKGCRYCTVSVTQVTVLSGEKYVFLNGLATLNDKPQIYPAQTIIYLCDERDNASGNCLNKTFETVLPCAYCVTINENHEVIEDTNMCELYFTAQFDKSRMQQILNQGLNDDK